MSNPVMDSPVINEQARPVARPPADGRPRDELAREGLAALEDSAVPRVVWKALWRSRLLVFASGCLAFFALGGTPEFGRSLDPTGIATSFGKLGNILAAPAVRWDGIWYLQIAHSGYGSVQASRFFPLYPLMIRAVSWSSHSAALAGVLISLAALAAALVLVHRLTALELGPRAADLTVELIAFGPLALYLSAIYSESLFLALSVGTFYAARRGRWATAGALGGLAALTRVTGFLLVVPVVLIFLYGPRTDTAQAPPSSRFRPRYRPTPALLYAALIPAGTVAYSLYLWLRGYAPLSFLRAQTHLLRHVLTAPVITVWEAAHSAWYQVRLGVTGYAGTSVHLQSVVGLCALIVALVALCGVLRRLPLAYGAYAALGLLVPLSTPTAGDPLRGLARYEMVLFPLYMSAAAWASERGVRRPVLLGCCALLVLFTAQFATWHVVGTELL